MTETAAPIRVVRVISRLNIGGPSIHVTLLNKLLDERGYDTTLVTGEVTPDEGDMSYYAEAQGVEPMRIASLGRNPNLMSDLQAMRDLARVIREVKPHVVHTHTAKAGFIGRMAAWSAGVPVIVHTFHGHVFHGYFGPVKTRLYITMEQIAGRVSTTLITLTQGLRQELSEEYHIARKSRITVLPLGIELDRFYNVERKTGAFRATYNIPDDVPLVGLVGRLAPIKNHALFLRTAKQVLQTVPDAMFVVVGDGELRQELEALTVSLGIEDSVIFTGWLRDLPPIYADLDLGVISSYNEGTPVSVIEGLASGCPFVATHVGGMHELLDGGRFGVLVPSEDQTALANAIVDTLHNPPDVSVARDAMIERYSINRLVNDIDGLYRGLLKRKRVSLN